MATWQWASFLILPALGSCVGIQAFGGYTQMQMSGTLALNDSGNTNNLDNIQNDVSTDLGLGDQVGAPYARATLDLGAITLTGSGFTFDVNGSGTLSQPFGDLPAGRTVDTDFKLLNVKGAIALDLIDIGTFRLSPGVAVDFFDVEFSMEDTATMEFEQVDTLAPVPMLFLQGEVSLGPVGAAVDFGWIEADFGDVDGTWLDIEGLATMTIVPSLEVFAGYRYISIDTTGDADGQDYAANLQLEGWTVGLGLVW